MPTLGVAGVGGDLGVRASIFCFCAAGGVDVDDIIHERFFSLRIATSDVHDFAQKEEDIIFLLYRSLLDDRRGRQTLFFGGVLVVVSRCSSMRDDAVQSDKRERERLSV